ncbi:hypothetical protein TPAU25S_00935 [Tsukamurella paurometabola]
MRVIVVGAGQVGHTVVKSLAETHDCTVIDIDEARLQALSHTYDVRVTRGSDRARRRSTPVWPTRNWSWRARHGTRSTW